MANLTSIPAIDDFETQLSSSYNWWTGTINATSVPSWTIESGETSYLVINPWKPNMQVVVIDGWNSWSNTFNVTSVTVEKWNGVNYTPQTHAANSVVRFSNNYAFRKDIRTAVNSKVSTDSDVVFQKKVSFSWTDSAGLNVKSLTTTQRNALTPTEWDKIINTTLWVEQTYIGWSWVDSWPWATTPNLSETVTGKGRYTNDAQFEDGTDTDWSGNPLIPKPSQVKNNVPESLVDKDTYVLWEDCLVNDSLFAETAPTFAESTSVQNIGEATGNTRVALYDFGSWVSWSTYKLWLRKFTSPSASLSVRLETLDGSGNATGTLVHANANGTVTAASLITSLADTTVTFAWSFTIPLWQEFAIVLNQVWDVVNGTNYYGVGYVARDTSTRKAKTWNGTVWSAGQNDRFYYTSSTLALRTVLSKTDADYTHKLPTDFPRFAHEAKSAGQNVICTYDWLKRWFTGLSFVPYYVSGAAWAISTTPWSYVYSVWDWYNGNTLRVYSKAIFWRIPSQTITTSTSWDVFHSFVAPSKWVYNLRFIAASWAGWQTIRIVINSTVVYESASLSWTATTYMWTFWTDTGDTIQLVGRSSSSLSTITISDIHVQI